MRNHTKIWIKHFGEPFCEITGQTGTDGKDVHHIDARGMGGDPKKRKDRIDNIMCVQRPLHTFVEKNPKYKWWFKLVHMCVLMYKIPYTQMHISNSDPILKEILIKVYGEDKR